MEKGELGKNYAEGEIIFREEKGDVMYAIQSGKVKITKVTPSGEITMLPCRREISSGRWRCLTGFPAPQMPWPWLTHVY
jgi:hypothetical protein